jgi:hypothetical protein
MVYEDKTVIQYCIQYKTELFTAEFNLIWKKTKNFAFDRLYTPILCMKSSKKISVAIIVNVW